MRFSVKKIINAPGERLPFSFEMDLSDVEFGGLYPIQKPVVVAGEVRNIAGMLLLQLEASTVLNSVCDRCMKPFENPKTVRYEAMLAEQVQDEDNDDIILLENDEFDLEDLARTVFILEMDTKTLCSEDCKGLCPKCGADLNQGSCNCKPDTDPRLAVLAKLLEKD